MKFTKYNMFDSLTKPFKVVRHIEMPKSSPKKSVCEVQKLAMILKWN